MGYLQHIGRLGLTEMKDVCLLLCGCRYCKSVCGSLAGEVVEMPEGIAKWQSPLH